MNKCFACLVTVLLATTALCMAGPDKDSVMAKENAAWQAFKDKNADAFQKVVDKDIRCVYDAGTMKMSDELTSMKASEVRSFAISDFQIFSDEKDVIVATYTVKLDGTQDGKDASGTYNAGTVWKEENGEWLAIFHTQVKQAK